MTPYDTALRVQRREVDTVRVSINVAVEQVTTIETARTTLDARMEGERALAADMWIPTDAWAARMRSERTRLAEAQRLADARLAQLRARALEVYGTMRAIEGAADRYSEESERTAAVAEQARIDDLGAAKLVRLAAIKRGQS